MLSTKVEIAVIMRRTIYATPRDSASKVWVHGISAAARAVAALFPPPCAWIRYGDYYRSVCGHDFEFAAGGPRDNDFVICPYCGGEIKEGAEC